MKPARTRGMARALAAVLAVLCAGIGLGTWLVVRHPGPQRPQISVYSNGNLIRVGPYQYCDVLNLKDCQTPQAQGELRVSGRYPVQLSVPDAIYRAPWRLLKVYDDPANTTATMYRPGTHYAVTISPVDPRRGRLTGIVVQLLTLVVAPSGELREAPHAEWSVRLSF